MNQTAKKPEHREELRKEFMPGQWQRKVPHAGGPMLPGSLKDPHVLLVTA